MVKITRHHGRNGAIYVSVTSGAAASPCAFQAAWSLNKVTAKQDVTAFGDQNLVYVAGLPDASGDFSGFWTVLPDYSIDGAIAGAVNFKATWNAASRIWQYNPAIGGIV